MSKKLFGITGILFLLVCTLVVAQEDDFYSFDQNQQQEFLLDNPDSADFDVYARDYLLASDFSDIQDLTVAEDFFRSDDGSNLANVNDNKKLFERYIGVQGSKMTMLGNLKGFSELGDLQGKNQNINLDDFLESPAKDKYELFVDGDGTLRIVTKQDLIVKFTGTLAPNPAGGFDLDDGTFEDNKIKGGKGLVFDEGANLVDGTITHFNGIEFEGDTRVSIGTSRYGDVGTAEVDYVNVLDGGTIKSVEAGSSAFIAGDVQITDYDAIDDPIRIPRGQTLNVNGVSMTAPFETTAVDFGKKSLVELAAGASAERYTNYVRFVSDDRIEGFGSEDFEISFNSENFVSEADDPSKEDDVQILLNSANFKINNKDGKLSFGLSDGSQINIGDNEYFVQEGNILKTPGMTDKSVTHEISSAPGDSVVTVDDTGTSVNVIGGKSDFLVVDAADLLLARVQDPDAIQFRINDIVNKIELGVDLTSSDINYLKTLYKGVAVGGAWKLGYNSGKALNAYISGKGGDVDFDPDLWRESNIVSKKVFPEIKRDVRNLVAGGQTSGTIHELVEPIRPDDQLKDTKGTDPELFYASHNSFLDGTWELGDDGKIHFNLEVNDLYDFEKYSSDEGDEPGTIRKVTPLPMGQGKVIDLPGSLAYHLENIKDEDGEPLAKRFNMHTEWEETIEVDCTIYEYADDTCIKDEEQGG